MELILYFIEILFNCNLDLRSCLLLLPLVRPRQTRLRVFLQILFDYLALLGDVILCTLAAGIAVHAAARAVLVVEADIVFSLLHLGLRFIDPSTRSHGLLSVSQRSRLYILLCVIDRESEAVAEIVLLFLFSLLQQLRLGLLVESYILEVCFAVWL